MSFIKSYTFKEYRYKFVGGKSCTFIVQIFKNDEYKETRVHYSKKEVYEKYSKHFLTLKDDFEKYLNDY